MVLVAACSGDPEVTITTENASLSTCAGATSERSTQVNITMSPNDGNIAFVLSASGLPSGVSSVFQPANSAWHYPGAPVFLYLTAEPSAPAARTTSTITATSFAVADVDDPEVSATTTIEVEVTGPCP